NEMDLLVNQVHDFADMTRTCTNPKDTFYHDTWKGRQVSDTVRNAERVRSRDYDGIEARLVELAQDRGFAKPRQGYDSNWCATALASGPSSRGASPTSWSMSSRTPILCRRKSFSCCRRTNRASEAGARLVPPQASFSLLGIPSSRFTGSAGRTSGPISKSG